MSFAFAPHRDSNIIPSMGTRVLKQKDILLSISFACAPTGIRTPVLTLKGSRPGPLDDGGGIIKAGEILSSHLIMVKHLLRLKLYTSQGRRVNWLEWL